MLEDLGIVRYPIRTGDVKELRKVFNEVLLKVYLDPALLSETPKIPESVVSKSKP